MDLICKVGKISQRVPLAEWPIWEAPPKRSTFFKLQVYKSVEISLAEVFKWVGTSVILVHKKRPKRAKRWILLVRKVEENALVLFFIHNLKIVQVQQLKRMRSSKLDMWEGYHWSIEGIQPQRYWISGQSLPV